MAVTMAEITKLRNLTSAGLMDCKKALAETNGDIDAAVELLRQKGKAVAAQRGDRQASEGCVLAKNEGRLRRHRSPLLRDRLRCQERRLRRAHTASARRSNRCPHSDPRRTQRNDYRRPEGQ